MMNLNKIRNDFPILQQTIYNKPLVYLDNAATTQKPKAVLESVLKFYYSYNSNIHRGVHYLSEQASAAYEGARKKIQNFIQAKHEHEVIFTKGTTESVNLVAHSFAKDFLKAGDEIITTALEHHSNFVPWQVVCKQYEAQLKVIPLNSNGHLNMQKMKELINDKTKLISVAYVSNVLGLKTAVKEIIQLAKDYNIPVFIDAAQAIHHFPINVQELDVDFLAFSGHKMYAETGIGVLYGKEKWLDILPPYQLGGGMIDHVSIDKTTFAELPLKFEAGTPNYVGAVSMEAALNYMLEIGLDHIVKHESELTQYAEKKLNELNDIIVYGKTQERVGSLSFNFKNLHFYDVGMILDKMGIAIRTGMHCAEPLMRHLGVTGTLRASIGLYNSKEDIDFLMKGLKKAQEMLG